MLLVPIIVSWLAPFNTIKEWRSVFFLVFIILVITNFFFCKFCESRTEQWAMLKPLSNDNIQASLIDKNKKTNHV